MNLPIELKTRIYNHIGNVQQHLGEFEADEQREILESLETHIHDALESRSDGTPSARLLDAIISELDPPESYGPSPRHGAKTSARNVANNRRIIIITVASTAISIACILLLVEKLGKPPQDKPFPITESTEHMFFAPPAPQTPVSSRETSEPTTPIVGKWTAIDFIASISEFNPAHTNWKGELELKGLRFFVGGKTDKPWWTWKNNRLFHSGDQSEAELMIVTVNRTDYLFMEWMSGDVTERGALPRYYVFKRD